MVKGVAKVLNPDHIHDFETTRKMIHDIKLNGSEFDEVLHYVDPYDKIRQGKPAVVDVIPVVIDPVPAVVEVKPKK